MHNPKNLTESQLLEHVENQCKKNGVRLTQKRKNLLACLIGSDKALSAYEVADIYKARFDENIPVMSVYRILEFLEDQQFAHKLQLANKYIACIHMACQHSHDTPQFLICIQCSRVKEVSIDKRVVDEFKHNVSEAGFELASPQLEVNCLCHECKKQQAAEAVSEA